MSKTYVLPAAKAAARRLMKSERYAAAEAYACRESGARILDIGTGSDRMLRRLEKYPELKLYGMTLGEPKGQLIAAAPEDIPFSDEFFDTVISVDNLSQWGDMSAGLEEVRRVLKQGGALVGVFGEMDPYEVRRTARKGRFSDVKVKIITADRLWLLVCVK